MEFSVSGLAIGVLLAVAICLLGRLSGMDRDRATYPVILIVIAFYYVLFALMNESQASVMTELVVAALFSVLALLGFRGSLWLVVIGLAAHGIFDVLHPHILAETRAPEWWPGFCLGIDVALAVCLAWLLYSGRLGARAA